MSIHAALHHVTHYQYDRPVQLGPQVVRLRPAPHCRSNIISYSLRVEPAKHFINWQQDAFAHYQARLVFPEKTTQFKVTVDLVVEMAVFNPFDFFLEPTAEEFPFTYANLQARELAPYQLVLCAAPAYLANHPAIATPADLSQHECLGFSHTELRTHWTLDGPGGPVTVPVSGRFMANNGEALLAIATAGMGVMLQPLELVRAELESGRLVRVLPDWSAPVRPMHILYAPDRKLTPKLRSFIDFTVEAFGRDARVTPDRHSKQRVSTVETDPL